MNRKLIGRTLCLSAMILLFLCAFSLMAKCETVIASGECGPDITWQYTDDQVLTLSGTGAMNDYSSFQYVPWFNYRKSILQVVIDDRITSIGNYAFYDCYFESITIPSSVVSIGASAFGYCYKLESISIPSSVVSIGASAFGHCDKLESISIPSSVASIGKSAFRFCYKLKSISIPSSVAFIGDYAFSDNDSMTSVTFLGAKVEIGKYVFQRNTKLETVVLPTEMDVISEGLFSGCEELESIYLPSTITTIEKNAFAGCSSLESVTLPENVKTIGVYAFSSSGISTVTIPSGVTSIGSYAFYRCGLESVYFLGNSIDTIQDGTFLGSYFSSITIPSAVTSIGREAFADCGNLISVTIPSGVTSIGHKAFYDCRKLTSITIPDSVTSIGDYAFSFNRYYTREEALHIYLPDNITSIGSIDVDIYISEAETFYHCNIDSVTARSLGKQNQWIIAEENSDYAIRFIAAEGVEESNVLAIDGYIGNEPHPVIPSKIGNYLVAEITSFNYNSRITGVTIPNTVTNLGYSVFSGCTNLVSITLPEGIVEIPNYAFSDCSSLVSVSLPNSITSIGDGAFFKCTSLTDITLPSRIREIKTDTFDYCTSLKSIVIPELVRSIGPMAFYHCESLTEITLPGGISEIGDNNYPYAITNVFQGCTSLERVYLPDHVPTALLFDASSCFNTEKVTFYCYRSSAVVPWVEEYGYKYEYIDDVIPQVLSLPADAELKVNKQLEIIITTAPLASSEYEIQWTSSDPHVADVENGVVTAYSIGTTTVTASCGSLSDSMTITVYAPEDTYTIASGNYGPNLKWRLDSEGTLTISGSGYMYSDTDYDETPWYTLRGFIIKVVIEEGVTEISNNALYDCANLTSLEVPDGFRFTSNIIVNCPRLENIHAQSLEGWLNSRVGSASKMGYNLYINGELIENLVIPEGIKEIPNFAFYGCRSIKSVVLPEGMKGIGEYAFTYAMNLTSISLPDSFGYIGAYAFSNTGITSIHLPAGIAGINDGVFELCANLSEVTIAYPGGKNNRFRVGNYAFGNCYALSKITLPESTVCIGNSAFSYCSSLKSFVIPDRIAEALPDGFSDNASSGFGKSVFQGCISLTDIKWPERFTVIPTDTFGNCDSLTNAILHQNILHQNIEWIGGGAFGGCDGLTDIVLPQNIKSIGGAFQSCRNLVSIVLPQNIESIGDSAFSGCTKLSGITLPDNIKSIGAAAFSECTFTNITLPDSLEFIGAYAFTDCTSLKSIKIPSNVKCENGIFSNCHSLTSVTIGDNACFYGYLEACTLFEGCTNLSSLTLGDNVEFDFYAQSEKYFGPFRDCKKLSQVRLPGSAVPHDSFVDIFDGSIITILCYSTSEIATWADENGYMCIYLDMIDNIDNSLWVASGLTTIKAGTFGGCESLTSLYMPDSITFIAEDAFDGADNIVFICESTNTAAEYAKAHDIPFIIQ